MNQLDALRTASQFITNLGTNWSSHNLSPRLSVSSLTDPQLLPTLKERGIAGLIWDVDNTLMGYHGNELDPLVCRAYQELSRQYPGVIVSNSDDERYRQLGRIFPQVPVVRVYQIKNGRLVVEYGSANQQLRVYRKLYGGVSFLSDSMAGYSLNVEEREPLSVISPQHRHPILSHFSALRKPRPVVFQYAKTELGILAKDHQIAVIGDRLSTDISGGNQAGMYTVKVLPLRPETEPLMARVGRWCESVVYQWHGSEERFLPRHPPPSDR